MFLLATFSWLLWDCGLKHTIPFKFQRVTSTSFSYVAFLFSVLHPKNCDDVPLAPHCGSACIDCLMSLRRTYSVAQNDRCHHVQIIIGRWSQHGSQSRKQKGSGWRKGSPTPTFADAASWPYSNVVIVKIIYVTTKHLMCTYVPLAHIRVLDRIWKIIYK